MNVFFMAKYPVLPKAREFLADYFDIDIGELAGDEYKGAIERAAERVVQTIRRKRISFDSSNMIDYKSEILSFPVAIGLVVAINDDRLRQMFSIAEAKKCFDLMAAGGTDEILEVANNMLFPITETEEKGERGLSLKVPEYLRHSPQFWGPSWKLTNRRIVGGRVLLSSLELARLLEESIREQVLERTRRAIDHRGFSGLLKNEFELITQEWGIFKTQLGTFAIEERRDTPPCMVRLSSRQGKGENLSHVERRSLATYLIAIGRNVEELMEIFKTSPDFNERIARYQLEHLAGQRGGRRKYLPPSCKTMKTYGLCFPDQWCDNIRNPLQYRIG